MCSCLETVSFCSCEVSDWVGELLKDEKIKSYCVKVTGTSEKGDGYIGDITFVEVFAQKDENYHLVLKHGKKNEELRKQAPVRIAFEREIFIYAKVKPAFQKFLEEKGGVLKLDFMPKCYGTLLTEQQEVLALQNLKKAGYDLHDRKIAMDMKHIGLTLEAYGKWHAISFAFHDQNPQKFRELTSNLSDVWLEFCKAPLTEKLFQGIEENYLRSLRDHKKMELIEKFKRKYPDLFKSWLRLGNEEVEGENEVVITHGDCWNNNFMFKYEPDDKLKLNPTNVVMLDFQLSQLASPVVDLSYHIFMVATGKELDNLKGLLDIYYESLAENIRKLGSDPNKLFSYDALIRHWKKYHLVGLLLSGLVLPITLVDKEDTVNIEDMNEETMKELMNKMVSKTKENLDRRMIEVVKHAVTYEL